MNSETGQLEDRDLLAGLKSTKTNLALIEMLEHAKERKITEAELQEQRASYIYGSLSSKSVITKDDVRKFLAERECK